MKRKKTAQDVLKIKHKKYEFEGIFKTIFGNASKVGIWLIYGKDKNGKTWAALIIAAMLSKITQVLYISAEQGTDSAFQEALIRAKRDVKSKSLHFLEYATRAEIEERLTKRYPPKVVLIDNLTMYKGEITSQGIASLKLNFPNTHFILLAHEERNQPYTAAAIMAKKLAKIIIHVQGLALLVSGRCPGGTLLIDEEKAMLFHGTKIKE